MTVSRIVNRDYVIDWLDMIDAMIISIRTFYQLMIGGFILEILCHQIIEHCLCYSETMTESQFLKDLSETFPNCNFTIQRGVKLRLAVITQFYIYWFDILDSNYHTLRYLTCESLR